MPWPPRGAGGFSDFSLRDLAAKVLVQIDHHAARVGPDGLMPDALSDDGVHPNAGTCARTGPSPPATLVRHATSAPQIMDPPA